MSESESFIQEVTEEVRRERLFSLAKRYGWIAVLAIVVLVGAAAWNEWRKAQIQAEAEAFGDSLLTALEQEDPEQRLSALQAIPVDGAQSQVLALLMAAERVASGDRAAAAEALRPLASSTDAPVVYSDLAALKLVLLGDEGADAQTRAQILDRLAKPGAPYRLIALENQALALAASGDVSGAREAARSILQEADLTQNSVQRIVQLLQALGPDDEETADEEKG